MPCNRYPRDLFVITVLNRMLFQLLVKASLGLTDVEASRQAGVSSVLFFSTSNLVFSYSKEIYSIIYMIYSEDNS